MKRRLIWATVATIVTLAIPAPAAAQLAGRTAEEWINTLETPTRVQGLKVNETIQKLQLKPGQMIADIGAGTGIFSLPMARAVRPTGKVYAEDIDQELVDHILETGTEQGIANIVGVLGEFDDPNLPVDVDLAFINDVLHHIEHRALYLKNLALYLKPTGRIAIIEFKPGQGGHTNQPELQLSKDQVNAWMSDAGLTAVEDIDLFTDKWFVIYAKK